MSTVHERGFDNLRKKIIKTKKYMNNWILKQKKIKEVKNKIAPNDILSKKYKLEIKNYWSDYAKIELLWHEWYSSQNGLEDVRYIPEDIFYNKILPYYNNNMLATAYADKSYLNVFLDGVKSPETLIKNINGVYFEDNFNPITYKEVINVCLQESKLIIKPSIDSGLGKGIIFIEESNPEKKAKILESTLLQFEKDFVIQKVIKQHETMAYLNPTSINTVRIMSFLNQDEVTLLSPHVRIGMNNSKTDHFGVACGISQDGKLKDFLVNYSDGKRLMSHPDGHVIKGIEIPGFQKIKQIIKQEHYKLAHFRIISWDFAIDMSAEPVLIEVNLRYPGINNHQLTSGPLFEGLTDQILSEVFD